MWLANLSSEKYIMHPARVFLCLALCLSSGCAELMAPPAPPRAPCRPAVGPIRNQHLIVEIRYDLAYTARDPGEARRDARDNIMEELNALGFADGNSFAESNGQPINFYFTYTIYNDGQDHYTGQVQLAGWGWGLINTFYSGQYSYASPVIMERDLTAKAYAWINTGWHQTGCG